MEEAGVSKNLGPGDVRVMAAPDLVDVFFLVNSVEHFHQVAPSQFALADTAAPTA